MLCMLKHVRGVKGQNNLQHFQHASTYIVFDGMVGKPEVSAFQNFFWIENQVNIKNVMSKDVYEHFELLLTPLTCIALQPL